MRRPRQSLVCLKHVLHGRGYRLTLSSPECHHYDLTRIALGFILGAGLLILMAFSSYLAFFFAWALCFLGEDNIQQHRHEEGHSLRYFHLTSFMLRCLAPRLNGLHRNGACHLAVEHHAAKRFDARGAVQRFMQKCRSCPGVPGSTCVILVAWVTLGIAA